MIRGIVKEVSTYLQFKRDCREIFTTPQGRRILSYLMKKGCVTTAVACVDRDESLRNEGMQRLVLSLLKATYRNETELEQQLEEEQL